MVFGVSASFNSTSSTSSENLRSSSSSSPPPPPPRAADEGWPFCGVSPQTQSPLATKSKSSGSTAGSAAVAAPSPAPSTYVTVDLDSDEGDIDGSDKEKSITTKTTKETPDEVKLSAEEGKAALDESLTNFAPVFNERTSLSTNSSMTMTTTKGLVVKSDRSSAGKCVRGFFQRFHQYPSNNYTLVRPETVGFPSTAIICYFVGEGRYKIYNEGVVWSSLNKAGADLGVISTMSSYRGLGLRISPAKKKETSSPATKKASSSPATKKESSSKKVKKLSKAKNAAAWEPPKREDGLFSMGIPTVGDICMVYKGQKLNPSPHVQSKAIVVRCHNKGSNISRNDIAQRGRFGRYVNVNYEDGEHEDDVHLRFVELLPDGQATWNGKPRQSSPPPSPSPPAKKELINRDQVAQIGGGGDEVLKEQLREECKAHERTKQELQKMREQLQALVELKDTQKDLIAMQKGKLGEQKEEIGRLKEKNEGGGKRKLNDDDDGNAATSKKSKI